MERHRILVVDDEETIRHVLATVLEKNGCEVKQAGSAEDALPLLEGWEPEVALLDIVLPGMNGIRLLSEIKQIWRDTEILIMTSNASAETAIKSIRDGAYDYFKKPFNVRDIWVNVQRALEKRALAIKNRELLHDQEKRSRELSSEVAISAADARKPDHHSYSEVLDYFLDIVTRELDIERASLMLMDTASGELEVVASRGSYEQQVIGTRVKLGEGIAGSVAASGEPFVVADAKSDTRLKRSPRAHLSDSFLSVPVGMSVAIKSAENVVGVINVTNRRNGKPFGSDDLTYLTGLGSQLAVAIEGARKAEQLQNAYRSLKSTQDQLVFSERIKAVGQMAAGVAHDFNNVLSVVLGRAQFALAALDEEPNDLSKLRGHLNSIVKASQQGAQAIRRIQDYTRIRKDVPTGPVDLNNVIRDAVEISRPKWKDEVEARGRHVTVAYELAEVPNVSGNLYELTQVFGNLIFNAVEAMPDGGELAFISRPEGESVVVQVRDTGTGMDEETKRHLFDPFFTTKETGQGLGTSIIRGIVTRHRGDIGVESAPGKGTTFTLSFPAMTGAAEDTTAVAGRSGGDTPAPAARILMVDDDEEVRGLYTEALESVGHAVVGVSSADEAISAFREGTFDLVITDMSMIGMTGIELAKQLRASDTSLPVILLSGWAVQRDDERIREAGITDVLAKPCLMEELLGTIGSAIRTPVST